ncbi:MAG: extracellular solute-binding protein, partial [Erysipelotrichales bacterium]|nr:extracellular solute-binding protein [Erysipelotrichales bacterium]
MKKNLKYIFGLSLVALLSGCVINVTSNTSDMNLSSEPTNSSISSSLDEEGREQDKLSIMFYTGGYGEEWLQEITDAYMSATGNYVEIVADATISSKAEAQLQSKNGSEYDIFISHDLNWQDYADRGLLANLDDVYSGTTVDGDKFKDRVIPAAEKISKYQGVRDSEPHYYKVCQTQGAGGFVYNEDLFKA